MTNFSKLFTLVFCLSANVAVAQMPQNLLFQNGFPMQKGEAYLQNGLLIFNQFNFGVTNHFSAGTGIVPLFFWDEGFLYTFSAKYAFSVPDRNIAVGFSIFHLGMVNDYDGWSNGMFLPNMVVTCGTPNRHVSFLGGVNFGYFNRTYSPGNFSKDYDSGNPHPFFGLTTNLSKRGRIAFVMDNYLFQDGSGSEKDVIVFAQPGVRFFSKIGVVLDLSLGAVMDFYDYGDGVELDGYPTPWVGLLVPIKRKMPNRWPKNYARRK